MLLGLIVFLGVAILFFVLGTVLWKKQRIDLVNAWHTRHVKKEDVPSYTKLIAETLQQKKACFHLFRRLYTAIFRQDYSGKN